MARKKQAIEETLIERSSGNVFEDLGFPDAEEHLEKAKLVLAIQRAIEEEGLSQADAAKRLGIDQPQVSRMLRGNFRGYSVHRLYKFLNTFGHDVVVTVSPRHPKAVGHVTINIG